MTKTLFLELDHEIDWGLAAVGPAYLAAYLRQNGHQAVFLRVPLTMTAAQLVRAIDEHKPQIIGLSLTSRQWARAKALVPCLKQHLNIPVIAGGLQPTFSSDLVLNTPGFDYVCIGEGEQAMLEFVERIEQGQPVQGIKNIRARGDAMPKLRPPFEPIDQLPTMARDMLGERYGVVHVSTQRGCPYPCSYCAAATIANLYDGGYVSYGRRRSVENVLTELDEIRRQGDLNYVVFLDDTFTINHAWLHDFCPKYARQLRTPFSINARAETITPDLLALLAEAGCKHIVYGVESGSERVRRDILKRKIPNEQLVKAFRWSREAGIMVTANYMLGIPGERPEDIEQTLALHEELQPFDFGYFVYYPFPGTDLFRVCVQNGYLPDNYDDLAANHRQSILRLPDLSPDQISAYYQRFTDLRARDQTRRLSRDTDRDTHAGMVRSVEQFAQRA